MSMNDNDVDIELGVIDGKGSPSSPNEMEDVHLSGEEMEYSDDDGFVKAVLTHGIDSNYPTRKSIRHYHNPLGTIDVKVFDQVQTEVDEGDPSTIKDQDMYTNIMYKDNVSDESGGELGSASNSSSSEDEQHHSHHSHRHHHHKHKHHHHHHSHRHHRPHLRHRHNNDINDENGSHVRSRRYKRNPLRKTYNIRIPVDNDTNGEESADNWRLISDRQLKDVHTMPLDTLKGLLRTDFDRGLNDDEVQERFNLYGPNRVVIPKRRHRKETEPGVRRKTNVMREGRRQLIDPINLVVGDIVFLNAGEEVPGDMRVLFAAKGSSVDRSTITGTAEDSFDCSNLSTHDDFRRTENLLFFKTVLKQGNVIGCVVATGDDTEYGKIVREHAAVGAMQEHHPHVPKANSTTMHRLMKRWVLPKTTRGTGALAVLDVLVVDCIGVITQKISRVEHIMCDWTMYDRHDVPKQSRAFQAILRAIVLCNTAEFVHKKHKVEGAHSSSSVGVGAHASSTRDHHQSADPININSDNPEEIPVHGHHPVDGTLLRFYEQHSPLPSANFDSYIEERERWPRMCKLTLAGCTGKVDISVHQYYHDRDESRKKSTYQMLKSSVFHLGRSRPNGLVSASKMPNPPAWGEDMGTEDEEEFIEDEEEDDYDEEEDTRSTVSTTATNNDDVNNKKGKEKEPRKRRPTHRKQSVPVFVKEATQEDNTFLVVAKGAPERIFPMCDKVLLRGHVYNLGEKKKSKDGKTVEEELLEHLLQFYEQIGSHFESIFALAQRTLHEEDFPTDFNFRVEPEPNFPINEGYTFLGFVSIGVPPYPNIKHTIDRFREIGTQIILCSTFHPLTVKTIAKKSHIITHDTVRDIAMKEGVDLADVDPSRAKAVVVHGELLSRLEHNELKSLLLNHSEVAFARILPHQKAQVIKALKELDLVVGVTGASVGDVQALKSAHVGIALHDAPALAKDAADVIVLRDNDCLQTIMNACDIVKNQKPGPCTCIAQ